MQNKMICPKCGKEMQAGALGPTEKGSLFWADNEYFKKKFNNFMTLRNALNNGAIRIRVGNGLTSNRTQAWACRDCKMVLVDCN